MWSFLFFCFLNCGMGQTRALHICQASVPPLSYTPAQCIGFFLAGAGVGFELRASHLLGLLAGPPPLEPCCQPSVYSLKFKARAAQT
jgi:hypothetical protein